MLRVRAGKRVRMYVCLGVGRGEPIPPVSASIMGVCVVGHTLWAQRDEKERTLLSQRAGGRGEEGEEREFGEKRIAIRPSAQ